MKKKQHIRLATRDSKLALWQAQFIQKKLKAIDVTSELILVKSQGDLSQKKAVRQLNSVGIFTKAIDDAVLDGRADAGVHSLKDLPTTLHKKLIIGCVPKREIPFDVLVYKEENFIPDIPERAVIATGSARRRAQWLHQFPKHKIVPVRGNVDSRLQKLTDSNWDGMILAAAGLKRLRINAPFIQLKWMLSAPGQGAIVVVCREEDRSSASALAKLNDKESLFSTLAERSFMQRLHAGCTAPVGAFAKMRGGYLILKGEILSADGKEKIAVEIKGKLADARKLGVTLANVAIAHGANELLKR